MIINIHLKWRVAIVLLLTLTPQARSDDSIDKDVQHSVEQCPSADLKIEYLSTFIATNEDSAYATNNIRKSSAIALLGQVGGTNVIGILVSNLTYIDKRYNGSPASHALIMIGEPAVPRLLDVLKNSEDEARIKWAALTIGFIENRDWTEFSEQQKKILPKEAWNRLIRNVIIVN
jgi:hypothetical protein